MVAAVAINMKADWHVTCIDLTTAYGVSFGTIHNIPHDKLGLVKKSQ